MQDRCDSLKWEEYEVWYISHSKYSSARRWNGQVDWSPVLTSISQEYFEGLKSDIERSHDGGYQRQDNHQESQCKYYFIHTKSNKLEHNILL